MVRCLTLTKKFIMKKTLSTFIFLCFNLLVSGQQLLKGKETYLSFFSSTPMEDIAAKNKFVVLVVKPSTGAIQIQAQNMGFAFEKPLMQEHFNENYMESEKFPQSSFSGKLIEPVDYSKDGVNNVTAKGKLTIHGVTQDVEVKGKIIVASGKISLDAKFPVKLSDYGIKVPTVVTQKIAESVEVSITSLLEPVEPGKK